MYVCMKLCEPNLPPEDAQPLGQANSVIQEGYVSVCMYQQWCHRGVVDGRVDITILTLHTLMNVTYISDVCMYVCM